MDFKLGALVNVSLTRHCSQPYATGLFLTPWKHQKTSFIWRGVSEPCQRSKMELLWKHFMVTFFAKSFILDVYTISEYISGTAKLSFTMLCYKWFNKANTVKGFHCREYSDEFGQIKTSLKEVFREVSKFWCNDALLNEYGSLSRVDIFSCLWTNSNNFFFYLL